MSHPSASIIETCLDEFDSLWQEGKSPTAAAFIHRFHDDELDDFVELIYHEFCVNEQAGLSPVPQEFLDRYKRFQPSLEKLFALHFGMDGSYDSGESLITSAAIMPGVGDSIGTYRIVEILGQGTAGLVVKALQADLGDRPVVLKISTHGPVGDAMFQARAVHPNIIPVFRHFSTDDGSLHVMVMPFLPGLSLQSLLHQARNQQKLLKNRRFRPDLDLLLASSCKNQNDSELLTGIAKNDQTKHAWRLWVATTAEALAQALFAGFQAGVIHGDIKPSNIYVDSQGKPYLIDYHLAREWQMQRHRRLVMTSDPGGTLYYMPPERLKPLAKLLTLNGGAREKPARFDAKNLHRADLYSLGIVLLEMLTGMAPAEFANHQPDSPAETAKTLAELRSDPLWYHYVRGYKQIPEPFQKLLASLLDPEPSARPQDAEQLAIELKRIQVWEQNRLNLRARIKRWAATRLLPVTLVLASSGLFAAWSIQAERVDSAQAVARLWAQPDLLNPDPAENDGRPDSVRLKEARLQFDQAVASQSYLWTPSLWRFVCMNSPNRLDAEFWFADRVERLSAKLELRARSSSTDDDKAAAVSILNQGLSKFEIPSWRDRAKKLSELKRVEFKSTQFGKYNGLKKDELEQFTNQIQQESQDRFVAVDNWEQLNRKIPESFAIAWSAGRFQALNGYYDRAMTTVTQALKLHPDHFEARRLAAFCEFKNLHYGKALSYLEMALKNRPDDLASLRLQAILRIYSGQRYELVREIQRLEEIVAYRKDDDNHIGLEILKNPFDNSVNYVDQDQEIFNQETIKILVKLLPGDSQIMNLQAKRYYMDRNYEEAMTILEALQKSERLTTGDMLNLATLYSVQKQDLRARKLVSELLEREDFSRFFQKQKAARDLCFTVIRKTEDLEPSTALIYYEKLARHCMQKGMDLGRCHYRMARCLAIQNPDSNLKRIEQNLIKAGQQHLSFIKNWYTTDEVFDPVREMINPVLSSVFPSLDSIADIQVGSP